MTTLSIEPRVQRMHVIHALVVGAAVLGFLFILLWATEAVGIGPFPPQFMEMFRGDPQEGAWVSLMRGMPTALSLGAAAGTAIAVFANMFRFLDKR